MATLIEKLLNSLILTDTIYLNLIKTDRCIINHKKIISIKLV